MTDMFLTYAKVGGPPDDWMDLVITETDSGAEVRRVVEVDTKAGWLLRHAANDKGNAYLCDGAPGCAYCADGETEPHVRTVRERGNYTVRRVVR